MTLTWMGAVLGEMTRVTGLGGRVILLAPVVPVSVMPRELRVTRREPIRLLGTKTTLWVCDRLCSHMWRTPDPAAAALTRARC